MGFASTLALRVSCSDRKPAPLKSPINATERPKPELAMPVSVVPAVLPMPDAEPCYTYATPVNEE